MPIILTDADDLTRPIHDRMPVVLQKADIGRNDEAGTKLLKQPRRISSACGRRHGVSTGTADDDPTLLDEWRPVMVGARSKPKPNRRHPLP
jgi:hypothetical protein